jgi:hypothetical protein
MLDKLSQIIKNKHRENKILIKKLNSLRLNKNNTNISNDDLLNISEITTDSCLNKSKDM